MALIASRASLQGPSGFSLLSIFTAPGGSLRLSMATWAMANSPPKGKVAPPASTAAIRPKLRREKPRARKSFFCSDVRTTAFFSYIVDLDRFFWILSAFRPADNAHPSARTHLGRETTDVRG